jgi:hypothetical protein
MPVIAVKISGQACFGTQFRPVISKKYHPIRCKQFLECPTSSKPPTLLESYVEAQSSCIVVSVAARNVGQVSITNVSVLVPSKHRIDRL